MIISVQSSESVDFGYYLTNRDKDAFFVIEGDSKRIDSLAQEYLNTGVKKKNSHTSFVLSFKEDNLTKNQLIDYYHEFKKMMFKNYIDEELEILSVIHFDDNKPHIHCNVLNGSMIDSFRELRLFRGNVDIPRNNAIQEIINYNNGLESVFNNFNLLSLTDEQQKRDWLIKHDARKNYRVFDDDFFDFIEKNINSVYNYDEFLNKIKTKYGKVVINKYSSLIKQGINLSTILKQNQLVLTEHKKNKIDNYVYNSKLFDKRWFNKHLKEIQDALKNGIAFKDIKFSERRKSKKEYERILTETTAKHENHLYERKIGKKYLGTNFNFVLENRVKKLIDEYNKIDDESLSSFIIKSERYLSFCNEQYINKFVKDFGGIDHFKINIDKSINYNGNNGTVTYFSENLYNYLSKSDDKFDKDNEYFLFMELLAKISHLKYKDKIRIFLENEIFKHRVLTKKELEELLRHFGLRVIRAGEDRKKGKYLTLENEFGKLALYNDKIVEIYKNTYFQKEEYKNKRDDKIKKHLNKDFLRNLVSEVYLKHIDKYNTMYNRVQSVGHYETLNSKPLDNFFLKSELTTKKLNINNYPHFTENEIIKQYGENGVEIEKSLDGFLTGYRMAEMFYKKGFSEIYLSTGVNEDTKNGVIARIKECGYHVDVFLESKNSKELLFSNKNNTSVNLGINKNISEISIDDDLEKNKIESITQELTNDVSKELENLDIDDKDWEDLVNLSKELKVKHPSLH